MANFCMHKSSISSSRKILHCLKRELEFPFSWMGVFSLPTWFIGALMFNKRDIQSHSPWLAFLLLAHPKECAIHATAYFTSHLRCLQNISYLPRLNWIIDLHLCPFLETCPSPRMVPEHSDEFRRNLRHVLVILLFLFILSPSNSSLSPADSISNSYLKSISTIHI